MKEVFINILNANNGELPPNLTIEDCIKMKEYKIYEWYEYNRKKQKEKEKEMSLEKRAELYKLENWVKAKAKKICKK